MKMRVRIEGLPPITSALRRAHQMAAREMERGLRRMVNLVRRRAQETAPEQSGRLRKSVRGSVREMKGMVFSRLWYAEIREKGTAHLPGGAIRPKQLKSKRVRRVRTRLKGGIEVSRPRRHAWLQFQVGGKWVRPRQVRQSGSFFLKRALEESLSAIQQQVVRTAQRMAKRLLGGR